MYYKNLGAFIEKLEAIGELRRVGAQVDPCLEITRIADLTVKKGGPALLFENVRGSRWPLLIGAFASERRMALALGVDKLDDLADGIADILNLAETRDLHSAVAAAPSLLRFACAPTRPSATAPCRQVVEEPDLRTLPILKCWPGDAGRFLTLPLVFTRDPDTGRQNVGMYRMQVYDRRTTGMHWHRHKDGNEIYEKYRRRGERMPVSVVVGCDPATVYAATAPLPAMLDEMLLAGYLRRCPVPMTRCVTNDIMVPAQSEFVLEGHINPREPLRAEGPFGDHTGYYSEQGMYPVFHVDKITRRENPVFMATIVGRPPMEDCFMAKATERFFLPLIRMMSPEIRDINFPLEGVFHGCVIVSIDKRYPMHAKKIMHTIWGMGQMMYTKMIVVVDAAVSPHDLSQVAWRVFNNIDAARDLVVSEGPLDALDHASPHALWGSRLGIDATKKLPAEGHDRPWPRDIRMSRSIAELVHRRWGEYGL